MCVSKFGPKAGAAQEAGALETRLGLHIPSAAARIHDFFYRNYDELDFAQPTERKCRKFF
jgi:hypothetical protein